MEEELPACGDDKSIVGGRGRFKRPDCGRARARASCPLPSLIWPQTETAAARFCSCGLGWLTP